MKKLLKTIFACGLVASGMQLANANPVMRLSADGGVTWTNIVDNGPADSDPTPGLVSYQGTVGNWVVTIATGVGQPLSGSSVTPIMDVGTLDLSLDAESLIVQMSDTNFIPFPNETFVAHLLANTGGTVTYNSYRDTGNVLFGTTANSGTASLLMSQGPFSGGNNLASNSVVVVNGGNSPFSLTLETVIIHPAGAQTSTDATLFALPPPPCNCTLTFQGQQFVTNCPGDAIPGVTATQDCGAGPVSVPVKLLTASTNGSCPAVITRTFTATNDCGQGSTFTQTIRVNCNPDCTITPSVMTTTPGATNTASVANAGPGATYAWNILNGSIVSGQNTPTLTWKAGTDTNSPITIMVTITAATGCQSACSTSVKLVCPPGKFGKGDTATIGFWHNKNGQGLITNAPSGPPTLANWLATTFPCLYGASAPSGNNLTGKSNADVAAFYLTKFNGGSPKTDAQVMAVALACYFTDSTLGGGSGPGKFGFNNTVGGTGAKLFNVGSYGTALGLQNNTSYTILQILQAANNVKCSNQNATLPNDLFDSINSGGDIS